MNEFCNNSLYLCVVGYHIHWPEDASQEIKSPPLCIHKHVLSAYYVPGTMLGARNTGMRNTPWSLARKKQLKMQYLLRPIIEINYESWKGQILLSFSENQILYPSISRMAMKKEWGWGTGRGLRNHKLLPRVIKEIRSIFSTILNSWQNLPFTFHSPIHPSAFAHSLSLQP